MVMVLLVLQTTIIRKDAYPVMYVKAGCLLLFLTGILPVKATNIELPNVTLIDNQLLQNLGVDNFFLSGVYLKITMTSKYQAKQPFTILAPINSAKLKMNNIKRESHIKQIILDHIVLGPIINLTNATKDLTFHTLRGSTVYVRRKEDKLLANDVAVLNTKISVPNGALIILDNYIFWDDHIKRNLTHGKIDTSFQTDEKVKEESKITTNVTFLENILQVLSYLKSGVRVFQHFLSRSNVSKLLEDGEEYTVFVPTDHAFHRWHPIDWGFYPFSVPEFTENVIINHFIKGNYRQETIKNNEVAVTLGGRHVVFQNIPSLTVNGVAVLKGDTPVINGNIMFTGEVLFVNESVVSRLHQQHRDKETPPLLAFPWFGAQFLSHAFLALERDRRFAHITRFLNLADLAPHVSGTGYTFFVPVDTAFEELGLDKMPDNYLSNGNGLEILLNHFVKGRLYDRDLKDNMVLSTLGNKTINITRSKDKVKVNEAVIVESEVFVYNLGTMFYIDKVLFVNKELLPTTTFSPTNSNVKHSTKHAEDAQEEFTEYSYQPDVFYSESEVTTRSLIKSTESPKSTIK